jgi:hypothetical protein
MIERPIYWMELNVVEEILNRVLGFMPPRAVFWSALGTSLVALMFQYGYGWLDQITILPWRREENQEKRRKVLQEVEKNRQASRKKVT